MEVGQLSAGPQSELSVMLMLGEANSWTKMLLLKSPDGPTIIDLTIVPPLKSRYDFCNDAFCTVHVFGYQKEKPKFGSVYCAIPVTEASEGVADDEIGDAFELLFATLVD